MNEWNKRVWKLRPSALFTNLRNSNTKTLLVMDSHKAHLTDDYKKSLQRWYNTDLCIVPGGMTPLLQPADVCYNKSFKNKMKEKWNSWFAEEVEINDKVRRASYAIVAEWVSEVWKAVDSTMISNAFKHCGISKDQDFCQLHTRLQELLETATYNANEESTGITDDEQDVEISLIPIENEAE
ncbi:pogo transposable element with KRAB domain-like protein [Leptotrombidium deliense]|uniref:Pogo transposable element with KRAB domain-like protein n=1 Tax=Leptotrombidium deliense TaxID=299467 RepID=A0A443S9S4_9ACAR|nr:pogo transposable element with KRAB domain-like protein [Leptotrombidium deliense]